MECGYFVQGLALDVGHLGIGCGVTDDKEKKGTFVVGAVEEGVEEFHGTGGVGECGKAGVVEGGDE